MAATWLCVTDNYPTFGGVRGSLLPTVIRPGAMQKEDITGIHFPDASFGVAGVRFPDVSFAQVSNFPAVQLRSSLMENDR